MMKSMSVLKDHRQFLKKKKQAFFLQTDDGPLGPTSILLF